jgi:threonine dehydrogenase-like Zn-dependent dehydrogenase
VGRFPLHLAVGAELGNVDIVLSARCGTGYRDEAYVHGRTSYLAPEHEATVDANLERAVRLIEDGVIEVSRLLDHQIPFSVAPEAYRLFGAPNEALGVTLVHQT